MAAVAGPGGQGAGGLALSVLDGQDSAAQLGDASVLFEFVGAPEIGCHTPI